LHKCKATWAITGAPPGRIRGILEWVVIILINAPARIRTRDLWLWYHIELHAPTSSTQKLKLIGKGGQFTYTPTKSLRTGGAFYSKRYNR
jgi:hypothetical protein